MGIFGRLMGGAPGTKSKSTAPRRTEESGPRIELDRNDQEKRAKLKSLLSGYQTKIEQAEESRGKYEAPEVRDPAYAEALYGRDFIKQLLATGSVDTYEFTRQRGRGLVQWAFTDMMAKVEEALGIENQEEAA